jgi:hypothetical protein
MGQVVATHSKDSERVELELVLTALAHTPRLGSFLRYISERYFENRINEINEYNIATEVLGRSRSAFDASRDSIARVEAHRLRKRLKEYYESDGKWHEVQISLPPGSYVPVFTHRAPSPEMAFEPRPQADDHETERVSSTPLGEAEEAQVSAEIGIVQTSHPEPPALRKRTLLYITASFAALLVLSLVAVQFLSRSKSSNPPVVATLQQNDAAQPLLQNTAQVPLRLLAGYDGTPKIDGTGAYWQADRYFHFGGSWDRPKGFVARTSDPMLFEHSRNGEFSYDFPLRAGVYELHLYFVASEPATNNASTFTVYINGERVLGGFDINSDALGANIADERVFRDVSPGSNGLLHIGFTSERATPSLNAIEILPGIPHQQLPIRIVTQPTSLTDHSGQLWHADNYYMDGYTSTKRANISGTPDPDIFAAERYGHFTYAIPVDTRDRYTLILHFAESYFGPGASGVGGEGSRVFRVLCNGNTLLDNFDIYKEAGSLRALTKTFYHLKPTAQGKLDIAFEPIWNNATVSGIEVLDESQ